MANRRRQKLSTDLATSVLELLLWVTLAEVHRRT